MMPVDLVEWVKESATRTREDLPGGLLESSFEAYLGVWHTIGTRLRPGLNVFERDWDALIVLDACRVDALRAVAGEYSFLDEVPRVLSAGSGSHEWMAHTFRKKYSDEIARTAYTNPNGFSELCFIDHEYPPRRTVPFGSFRWDVADADDFGLLDINWKRGHDSELGIVPPRFMTDRGIRIGRETDFDRYIVHYYQPHKPYLAGPIRESRPPTDLESEPWEHLKSDAATRQEVWELYLDNLRFVLDDVAILLRNLDAERVVITADHGDAIGEFRAYGHPEGFLHPVTRYVPWAETTAADERTYHPDSGAEIGHEHRLETESRREEVDATVVDRLSELGYK